jgi:hypothetical protein
MSSQAVPPPNMGVAQVLMNTFNTTVRDARGAAVIVPSGVMPSVIEVDG